jgi:hypothetical protein
MAFGAMLGPAMAAQVYYKSTMPDGRIIYGDKPAPDAIKVEETTADTSKTGVQTVAPGDAAALKKLEQERLKRERADERVREAEKALADAEAALAKGEEPLPGERIGTAGKGSRLTESYWMRQKTLKDNVERARLALERARAQPR